MSNLGLLRRLAASAVLGLLAAGTVTLGATADPAPAALSGTSASAAKLPRVFGPRTATAPGAYAFATVLDGQPVRWNPCAPIRWTADVRLGPAGGLQVLHESVAKIAALTDTTWTYVGPTATAPSSRLLPKTAQSAYPPVAIGWTDAASSDLLKGQPKNVLGMTRTAWFGVQLPDGSKKAATRAAVIALDRTDRLPLRGATSWSTVALHELGHTMGLAHVGDTRQLMATVMPRTLKDLQAGDRTGLAKVGRRAGCVVVPTLRAG